jgi:hypothetical protein
MTRAANAVPGPEAEFLYRRALALALEAVAGAIDSQPRRVIGMVLVSYQNLADHFGNRGRKAPQKAALREAYAFVAGHLLHPGTSESARATAYEYLDIALCNAVAVYTQEGWDDEQRLLLDEHEDVMRRVAAL